MKTELFIHFGAEVTWLSLLEGEEPCPSPAGGDCNQSH